MSEHEQPSRQHPGVPQPDQAPGSEGTSTQLAVDPSWSAPVAELGLPTSGRRGWTGPGIGVPLLLIVGALLLIVGLVWGLGGFERRKDLLKTTPPGTMIATGPYEFAFSGVTAQRRQDFDKRWYWEVRAVGSGRTTGNESIAPNLDPDYGMFVSRDDTTAQTQSASSLMIGTSQSILNNASDFTPGLPATDFQVVFKYTDTYKPGETLRFIASILEFRDASLTGQGEKEWRNTNYAYQFYLPVNVLPDQTY